MLIRRKAAVKESPMTVNERRKAIIDFLQQKHECDVNEIIAQFDVTPATIRRDLSHLEQAGSITRTHGAVQLVGSPAVPGFITRDTLFSQEKLAIAEAASQLVHSGDSVILDSGTTANAVAQRLVGRQDISLITNSLAILLSLKAPAQNLILTGGVLDYENLALIGPDAEAAFEHISASILFLGTTGVRGCDGMTAISPFQASIKRKMISCARRRILVVDSSKFNASGMILFASFSDIDTVVTSYPIQDPALRQTLDRKGIEVIAALG